MRPHGTSLARPPKGFDELSLTEMVEWINDHHHAPIRSELTHIHGAVAAVSDAMSAEHPQLLRMLALVREIDLDLRQHMRHEETELFPRIVRLDETLRIGLKAKAPDFDPEKAVFHRSHEHDRCEECLDELRASIASFKFEGAPPVLRAAIEQLEQLDHDLRMHFAVETSLLFPRALRAEEAVVAQQSSATLRAPPAGPAAAAASAWLREDLHLGREAAHVDCEALPLAQPEARGEMTGACHRRHPHETPAGHKLLRHAGEHVVEEPAQQVAVSRPSPHGRVREGERQAWHSMVSRVGRHELGARADRVQVAARDRERARIPVRPDEAPGRAEERALGELEPRAHERVPHDVVGPNAAEPRQRRGDRRVRRGGHIASAVREARVDQRARTQRDADARA